MANDYEFFNQQNPNMLFDLRQVYAIHIIAPILISLEEHKENNNFFQWYEKLTISLYTNIYQKLKEPERLEYEKEKEKCLKKLNEYREVYKGTDKNPLKVYELKNALIELEMWLKDKMEDHGLFGKAGEVDWDEI